MSATQLRSTTSVVRTDILDPAKVIATIDRLCLRIDDRFEDSGLLEVGRDLHSIAIETDLTIDWIVRPNYLLRAASYLTIGLLIALVVVATAQFEVAVAGKFTLTDFVTIAEAATNEIILIGAAIAFLVTMETRQKRKRIIAAVGELRSIAHVIDAHQLTKDPTAEDPTEHSPKRAMSAQELCRYLNYCSEMLSLTTKVAFLYVQNFSDPEAESAVHDLETLTIGLSSKIWQKLQVLYSRQDQ